MYHDAIRTLSAAYDCVYIDFFEFYEKIGINPTRDFADNGHLADTGASKLSDYLGTYLINNYGLFE